MEHPAKKSSSIRTLLTILLSVLVLRFIYIIFSSSSSTLTVPSTGFRSSANLLNPVLDADPSSQTKIFRMRVNSFKSVFQNLISNNFLTPDSEALIFGGLEGHEVLALKEIGVSKIAPAKLNPNLKFGNGTFDFVFLSDIIDGYKNLVEISSEIVRVLKKDGYAVILTKSGSNLYTVSSIQALFPRCKEVRIKRIDDSLRLFVFQKEKTVFSNNVPSSNKCSVPEHKMKLIQSAEPLIKEEPLKPWLTLKRNIKNIKYLPSVADISFKRRYVYIDIGARSYSSSIGSWFKKQYPKQNHTFEIYAIEADKAFHKEYLSKKDVNLIPFAAWIRNESISFEVNHEKGDKGMGRIREGGVPLEKDVEVIRGFDLAEWVKSSVMEEDFVVMKMDVEGSEFELIPRLVESGAICLVDELFLECHYNRWQRCCPGVRSPKYEKSYGECLELFGRLRDNGVLVHQWW